MSDGFALGAVLFVLLCWAGTLWAARSRIGELTQRLDETRAKAERAAALLAAGMERENRLAAGNAALRRALDAAEEAAQAKPGGKLHLRISAAVFLPVRLLDTVMGEKVLN